MNINDKIVVASVSGGKDSAALSLWLMEQGIEHKRVFADTGWEHEATYDYIRGPLQEKLGPIDWVSRPDGGMVELIRKKQMFPSRLRRYCTQELKVFPIIKYIKRVQDELGEVVNAVGIRAAESTARSKMTSEEWSDSFDCWVWRPLLAWSEQDVIDIHKRHGLTPNPLYLKGATRVGCWPCIYARKEEIRIVSELSPERIDEIEQLEVEVTAMAKSRADRDGNHADFVHGFDRTFFHGRNHRKNVPVSIREAVSWSQTSHGGRQLPLLRDEPNGCVRWGLCESDEDP